MILELLDMITDISNSVGYLDVVMILILFFSGYVFITEKGLKKGVIYLLILFSAGGAISVISKYANSTGKILLIVFILVCGFAWHRKKGK